MAQGAVKKSKAAVPTRAKKGAKVSKPKKTKTTADKVTKKYSAGLINKTEKLLGERAGHLELIGKGKKGKDPKDKQKGGSRKFG